MPTDKSGKFHLSTQRAHASDRVSEGKGKGSAAKESSEPKAESGGEGGSSHTIHANGDGTYHSEGAGGSMEHPTLGHAITHAAHHLAGGGKHMHHSSMGDGAVTSHTMDEGGEHMENQHGSGEEAGAETAAVMGDGQMGGEMGGQDMGQQQPPDAQHHNLAGF